MKKQAKELSKKLRLKPRPVCLYYPGITYCEWRITDQEWNHGGAQVLSDDQRKDFKRIRTRIEGCHWKDWCWSWNSNTLATWCEKLTHWKRSWCWEKLKAGGEGRTEGWDGWMASPTQWTWVWVNSGSWWWTGRPGMLQSHGVAKSQTLNWTELISLKPRE